MAADWDNDGASDLWVHDNTDATNREYVFDYVPELMTSVSNGAGLAVNITYDRLNHGTIYTKETNGTYPTVDLNGPTYVVSRVNSSNGLGTCVPPTPIVSAPPTLM